MGADERDGKRREDHGILAAPHPGDAIPACRDDDGRKVPGKRRRRRGRRGEIGHGKAAKFLGLDRVDDEQVDQRGELCTARGDRARR